MVTTPRDDPSRRPLPHYVGLHGAFTNGGDHLIVDRAATLFATVRPDRRLILRDRRTALDPDDPLVADAAAIILLGGPAWQRSTYPTIHPLAEPLERIRPPIIPFGLGWRGETTDEASTRPFDDSTMALLARIERDGHWGGVRDTTTLGILARNGLSRQLMTGCPSWYDAESLGHDPQPVRRVSSVAYSIGARSSNEDSFADFERDVVAAIRRRYPAARVSAVFHHPITPTPGYPVRRSERHARLAAALATDGCDIVDVSGSSESLISAYAAADLHVGMRVHAHLARCSKRQPSVLLAEDARAHVMCASLGHVAFESVDRSGERPVPRTAAIDELMAHVAAAEADEWPHLRTVAGIIDGTHAAMSWLLSKLP